MQVDMRAVIKKAGETYADDIRRILRDKLRYLSVNRLKSGVLETLRDGPERDQALQALRRKLRDHSVRGKRARRQIHCHRPAQRSGAQGSDALRSNRTSSLNNPA